SERLRERETETKRETLKRSLSEQPRADRGGASQPRPSTQQPTPAVPPFLSKRTKEFWERALDEGLKVSSSSSLEKEAEKKQQKVEQGRRKNAEEKQQENPAQTKYNLRKQTTNKKAE